MTNNIPENMNSVTPVFMVDGADKAIALYERALGAELVGRIEMPGTGTVMHAMFRVGNSMMFISDPVPDSDRTPPTGMSSAAFYVYVDDVDAAYAKAMEAGMEGVSAPEDMFWGDRTAVLHDGFGYNWTLATFQREVSPEEMAEVMEKMTE